VETRMDRTVCVALWREAMAAAWTGPLLDTHVERGVVALLLAAAIAARAPATPLPAVF
jgi:hypothetical protein